MTRFKPFHSKWMDDIQMKSVLQKWQYAINNLIEWRNWYVNDKVMQVWDEIYIIHQIHGSHFVLSRIGWYSTTIS